MLLYHVPSQKTIAFLTKDTHKNFSSQKYPCLLYTSTFPDAAAADEALNPEPMPEAAGNFHIKDDNLGVGGPKQKFARNIEAIQTLRTLEQDEKGSEIVFGKTK